MPLYFITSNEGKFAEAKEIIKNIERIDLDLPEIQHIDAKEVISAKLETAFNHKKGQFVVEDISLYLDCLNGLPGPLIKWFMKTLGNEGIYDLIGKYGNSHVQAKAIIGYGKSKSNIHFFEGSIKGTIVKPRGKMGFGWDAIFQPDGYYETFAEMSQEKKNKLSMRRIAFNKLKEHLS